MASFMHRNWGTLYMGTPAEHSIEPAIAALGLRYRFQHPFFLFKGETKYFPDFLWPDFKVILEVDDASHFGAKKMVEDAKRTTELEKRGYLVVRCTNEEALFAPEAVIQGRVRAALVSRGATLPE